MKTPSYQKAKDKMTIRRPHISIIALNVNRLNSPIKKHTVSDRINKQTNKRTKNNHMLPPETHLSSKHKYRLKAKR